MDGMFTNKFVVVREYQCTEGEEGLPCEDQDLLDAETAQTCDTESVDSTATLITAKRRGWGIALLDAMQNAVSKGCREEKQPHFTLPRKSLSSSPLRLDHHPPGLKKRGSRESTKW